MTSPSPATIERPKRIQRSRAKGSRLPDNTVCVDRSTKWGNPFEIGRDGTRAECVQMYKALLSGLACLTAAPDVNLQMAYRAMVAANLGELRGKNLACWCQGEPCHASVLLELANQ